MAIAERPERENADLVSLSEKIDITTAASKMVFRMLAVLSEFERDVIAERTKAAMAQLRSENRFPGQVPFGYALQDDGKTLATDARESEVIQEIKILKKQGNTLRGIAQVLNEQRIPAKPERLWCDISVITPVL